MRIKSGNLVLIGKSGKTPRTRDRWSEPVGDNDPFDLERFVSAQRAVYPNVIAELGRGRKTTHWIWFIFPQLRSLGRSARAMQYGIASIAEATAYLEHPVLGPRLAECAQLLLDCGESSIERIMPHPDDLKLQSSMTLFAIAANRVSADDGSADRARFQLVLDRFFEGRLDTNTLNILNQ